MKVSVKSIIINAVLTIIKLIAGIISNSSAMLSDAVHTASDVLSTIVVMIGVKISSKEPDKEHPYGHDRFESIAAMLLSIMLFATGLGIGYNGIMKVISGASGNLKAPGVLALVAAFISIVVKEWMYRFTKVVAEDINSDALMADAWHHRSDAFSSIGSLIGIFGARLGFPILDPITGIVICLFIIKAAYDIFMDAIKKITDHSCPPEKVEKMKEIILKQDGVKKLDSIKTRQFGPQAYVDVEISVLGEKTLHRAHEIATMVYDEIENSFDNVIHCMVHVNPYKEKNDNRGKTIDTAIE